MGGFQFVPDPEVASNFGNLFDNWGISEERAYITRLFSEIPKDSLPVLEFTHVADPIIEDTAFFHERYVLIVPHTLNNRPNYAQGTAIFRMSRSAQGYWSIFFWKDTKEGDIPSWSDIKASF
jgi:hypothetical protein